MKKNLSVFEMIVRSSIYKVLLVLIGMIAVEIIFFYAAIEQAGSFLFEAYIENGDFTLFFKIAYIVVTVLLVLSGMNIGSKQSYTLKRLRIKEKNVFCIQAIYNFLAYVLLWGTQLIVIFVTVAIYLNDLPGEVRWTNQSLLLLFYNNAFLHTLLPLESLVGWFLLIMTGIMSALATAEFTRLQRKGKFGFELLFLLVSVLVYFPRELGLNITFFLIVVGVLYLVMVTRWVRERGGDKNE